METRRRRIDSSLDCRTRQVALYGSLAKILVCLELLAQESARLFFPVKTLGESIEIPGLVGLDDKHIFYAHATVPPPVQPGLDGEDFACQQRAAVIVQQDRFVNIETNAMAGAMRHDGLVADLAACELKAVPGKS